MSKGNAEQPTAQAPRGHSSPNRVEVSGDGQQGAPQSPGTPRPQSPGTPGPRDQSSGNGTQDRTPTGPAWPTAKPTGPSPASSQAEQRATGLRRRRSTGRLAAARSLLGLPPARSHRRRATAVPERSADPADTSRRTTQQKQGRPGRPDRHSRSRCPRRRLSHDRNRRPAAKLRALPLQRSRVLHLRRPQGLPMHSRPLVPYPYGIRRRFQQPKQSVWARLGFGRKAEQPEENPTAPPAQQQPAAPMTQPPPTSPGGATGVDCAGRSSRSGRTADWYAGPAAPGAWKPARYSSRSGGRGGRWSDRGSRHPGRSPGRSAAAGRTAWHASGTGPARRDHRSYARRPGWCSAARASFWAASPDAIRTGQSSGTDAGSAGAPCRSGCSPGAGARRSGTYRPARNQPVPAGSEVAATEAHHAAKPKVGVARRTRKARLRLSRLDPWSVMKTSFLFSIAAGIMLVAAVYSVWTVLSTSQLFDSINEIVRSVVSTPGDTTPFRIQEYINTQKVMGVTALIACVDVVIFTALATLGSFLYNLAATMLGGLEITLAED